MSKKRKKIKLRNTCTYHNPDLSLSLSLELIDLSGDEDILQGSE